MAYRKNASQISQIRYVPPVSAPLDPPIPFTCSCVSETLDAQLWVTESAKYTQSYDNPSGPYSGSSLPFEAIEFRAFDDGRMQRFKDIMTGTSNLTSGFYSNQTKTWEAGNNATEETGLPHGGLSVKRAGCYCTELTKFKVHNQGSGMMTFRTIEFEDGYKLDGVGSAQSKKFLGEEICLLVVRPNEEQTKSIPSLMAVKDVEPGDLVLKCTNITNTNEKGHDCVKVTATGSFTDNNIKYVHSWETKWPQEEWSNSSVRGCLMLENGVYVVANPQGGSY